MADNSIYWRYDEQYKRQLKKLAEEEFSDRNKDLIRQFHNHLFATGTKQVRVAKLTWGLRKICRLAGRNLDDITKNDIERIVGQLQADNRYAENTKSDYKRALKHFYTWYEDEDPRLSNGDQERRHAAMKMYKYLRKYVKTTVKPAPVDPGSIVTDDEVEQVLRKGCKTDLERAFIKLMHETGARIGELLNIRLRDIQRKNSCWVVRVDGKTGERPRPILDSIPYLLRWLDVHPDPNNPDAYLWLSLHNRWRMHRIRYHGARRLIDRCFKGAGLEKKKKNPHFFRHSRATIDAPKMQDSTQCQIMGWKQGSRQVARYRHMAGKQAEEAYLKARGVTPQDEVEQAPPPKKCYCGRLNEPSAKYCSACGKALRLEVAHAEQEHLELAFELMKKTFSDPALLEQFEEWRKKKSIT